jgi:hypothetical protein
MRLSDELLTLLERVEAAIADSRALTVERRTLREQAQAGLELLHRNIAELSAWHSQRRRLLRVTVNQMQDMPTPVLEQRRAGLN